MCPHRLPLGTIYKMIIRLITAIGDVVNHDPVVGDRPRDLPGELPSLAGRER